MTWKNDQHGLLFKSSEIKLYRNGGHTWAMKLSQLPSQVGIVRIVTYSLPDLKYACEQIGRRPKDMYVICHKKFADLAAQIKERYPNVRIAVHDEVHSKICLIAPKTLYVGSANFGVSGWHETEVGIRSSEAHDWYVTNSFEPLWRECKEVQSESGVDA